MSGPIALPEIYNASTTFIDANLEKGLENKTAIAIGDHALSYGDIAGLTFQTGNALKKLGVQMEQRVLIVALDTPEFAACFFGAIRIGAIPIPVNTLLKPADYEYLLNDSRALVLIVSESLYENIEPIRNNLKWLEHVVVIGNPVPGTISFNVCFWLYSSGTTGFPKGAVHLQHDMIYCAENYARSILNIRETDRTFSVAKLFFAYGLGNGLYFPFYAGGTTILHPGRPEAKLIYKIITRHKPTLFFGVPASYRELLAMEDVSAYDLSSIRLCVSAGEALPKALYERWYERWNIEILDGIGSTEALHIFISNRPEEVRPGSSGKLVPGYDARILDEEDHILPAGTVGNLLIRGDSICSSYWNKHAKTKGTIQGEWIRTGDKYLVDEEGYFWYQGRSDDMMKAGGIWVSPVEVEATLMSHPTVFECAVIGASDKDELIKPKAYVVLKPGQAPSDLLAAELKTFVKDR
ncbi:MAG: benzoate-CoA ligase family protein, partial [Acidobacteriota bacterium]